MRESGDERDWEATILSIAIQFISVYRLYVNANRKMRPRLRSLGLVILGEENGGDGSIPIGDDPESEAV